MIIFRWSRILSICEESKQKIFMKQVIDENAGNLVIKKLFLSRKSLERRVKMGDNEVERILVLTFGYFGIKVVLVWVVFG